MFIVTPFLNFCPWGVQTYVVLGGFGLAGLTIQGRFSRAMDVAGLVGADYDSEDILLGEGVNGFRLAVLWATVILSLVVSRVWRVEKQNEAQNVIMNLTTLNAEIMFIALFGNPIYMGRLANYFTIFHTISLPWMLQYFEDRSRKIVAAIVIGYLAYFYYAYAISGGGFDA